MEHHPNQLYAIDFTPADQQRLAEFTCGADDWSRHASEWIRGSDVLDSVERETRVWLFETERREVVGFGSIGASTWRWPPPRGASTVVVLIPMLGIDARFQGQPADPRWRYSRQILSHLIGEGKKLAQEIHKEGDKPQWLVLLVHRDNSRAIKLYEQFGFQMLPNVVRRNDHRVMKLWIGE